MHYDFIVIGSGFGGSISALRLAEKGYKTVLVEQGRWLNSNDFSNAKTSLKELLWIPQLGMKGYFFQEIFKHISIVGGIGVGGGSNVYAAVLLKPHDSFYQDPTWNSLGIDWKSELAEHYAMASRMLGVVTNPHHGIQDDYLKATAEKMGAGSTFGAVPSGIYFGTPEVKTKDPYFDGTGPDRSGCYLCGECLTGCPHGSKNTLDKNYLYFAQQKGVEILANRKAVNIVPLENEKYRVELTDPHQAKKQNTPLTADNIVLSGGVLGTLDLLFRCRDVTRTLPKISRWLGKRVRTNSDERTHVTQNRFPQGYNYMRYCFGPLVDDDNPSRRFKKTLLQLLLHPKKSTTMIRSKAFYKRVTPLTVMQNIDNQLEFTYGRSIANRFGYRLKSQQVKENQAPTNLSVANRTAQALANVTNGFPANILTESLGNLGTTAHILGGCHIGKNEESAVIDTNHQVFGYPGIYIVDASVIPANVGVNPSLTISALAERAMSKIRNKSGV